MSKHLRQLIILLLLGCIAILIVDAMRGNGASEELKFSDFIAAVSSNKVDSVVIQGNTIKGKFISPQPAVNDKAVQKTYKEFNTHFRPEVNPSPEQLLLEHKVKVSIEEDGWSNWWVFFLNVIPILLLIVFFIIISKQANGASQGFGFGKSKHKSVSGDKVSVTFEDVAGVEEAKEELAEIVDYLKYPAKYKSLGARIPKGVLLLGSPGTGKTLLGKAVAGEAGVPFYYISGSDFVEMFVGVGASRVRDLFEQAKKTSPCIVFMDEIDAVGRQRGAGLGGGHDEREQTLNQLLVEMDGFDSDPNTSAVIVLAATNRPDVLDPALLRPGRFDRQVTVDRPDIAGRNAILKVHSRGKPLEPSVDLHELAQRTPGFSGADLENLLNEAALLAARRNHENISMEDCTEAIDRVLMGPERKSRILSEKDRKITAYHEGGHTLVARHIPDANPVRKVTILPRGQALGVTSIVPDKDCYNMNRSEILASIAVFMGGRVAEELVFDEITTGASNDIERATSLARDMVCMYGMSDRIGPMHFGRRQSQVFLGRDIAEHRNYSEQTSQLIDDEVKRIVNECYDKARSILQTHRHDLDILSDLLIEKELVEAKELDDIFGPSARELRQKEEDGNIEAAVTLEKSDADSAEAKSGEASEAEKSSDTEPDKDIIKEKTAILRKKSARLTELANLLRQKLAAPDANSELSSKETLAISKEMRDLNEELARLTDEVNAYNSQRRSQENGEAEK
ncbi:ATP-dependent zinc metalloprotease FtsH [bacterium]|nr:ATP-dependent zinc metalloprotease FtsH [bacterium]